jgi:HSP90 family molecular chaperone
VLWNFRWFSGERWGLQEAVLIILQEHKNWYPDNTANRLKLTKLVRFYFSKSEQRKNILKGLNCQNARRLKVIYYTTNDSWISVTAFSILKGLKKFGLQVLCSSNPINANFIQHLTEYESKKLIYFMHQVSKVLNYTTNTREERRSN